jgi:hypothetical protein
VLVASAFFDSAASGIIPGVGVAVGAAVVKVMSDRRKKAEKRDRDAHTENTTFEARVTELTQLMAGTPATLFAQRKPGIVERFDTLEKTVGEHGSLLVSIQAGIDKLTLGQEAAAKVERDKA